jgi:tetratricopeptide (TPR) repeat protein
LALDPLSSIINQDLGYVLMLAGRQDAAIRRYERTVELKPSFSTTWMVLAVARLEAGRLDDAASAFSRWAELTANDPALIRTLTAAAAAHPRSGKALRPPAAIAMVPQYSRAPLYMAFGQKELALSTLERALEQGRFSAVSAALRTVFDPLEDDPRFQVLIRKTGLVRQPRSRSR